MRLNSSHSNEMKPVLKLDPTPLATILELFNTTTFNTNQIFNENAKLKKYIFPKLKSEQIQKIRNAKDNIIEITDFLSKINFEFNLTNEEISYLIEIINQKEKSEVKRYASFVILAGFLSFVHRICSRQKIQYLIFKAFLHFDNDFIELGLSSFFFAFKIISRHKMDMITEDFLQYIGLFYVFDFYYPVEAVNVFYELIFNSYKVKSINIIPLVRIASQLSQNENLTFPPETADKFLKLFQSHFLELNIDYVKTFSSLLNKSTPNKFESVFSELPQHILNGLQQNCSILSSPEPNEIQCYSISIDDQKVFPSSYFTSGNDFFEKPFNPSTLLNSHKIGVISNQIEESLIYLFKSSQFLNEYSIDFLKGIATLIQAVQPYVFQLEDIYLKCAISLVKQIKSTELDIDSILNFPYLIDSQYTLFNCDCDSLFAVRKELIVFLLNYNQSKFFKQFMQNVIKWPLFYAEILTYLIELKSELNAFLAINHSLNFFLDSVNLYFKASQSCSGSDPEYIKELRIGRSYVILFLTEMVQDYHDLVMSKDKIIYLLLGQLFERNLKDYTITIMKNYLMKSTNPSALINGITTMINGGIAQELTVDNEENQNQCIDLLISLFGMLTEIENVKNIDGVEQILKSVSSLQLDKKNEKSIEFFYCFLNFLYLLRKRISLKSFIPFISKCIDNLFDDFNNNDKLYSSLILFIQDKPITSPEFLHLILSIFEHSNFLNKFMNLLMELLKVNENKIKFHDCGFDEYLIDSLNENEEELSLLKLKVFKEIAITKSSSSVVFKFISKLRPSDNSYLPKNEDILLNILRELSLNYYFEYNNYLSYSCGKNYKSITNQCYPFSTSNCTFTFYFWIFFHNKYDICQAEQEFSLIKITTDLSFVLKNNKIYLKAKNQYYLVEGIKDLWKWNLISISSSNKDGLELQIQVNESILQKKIDFNHFIFDISTIKIGDPNLNGNNDIEICNVSLIKGKKAVISTKKIFGNEPYKQNVLFQKLLNNNKKENFVFYLLNSWEIDIILPLFALNHFYYSMEIFVPLLLSIRNPNKEIFMALSCILSTYSPNNLTFVIYNRFYELYEFINNKELKNTLFINILSNDEIWSQNESEVEKIVRHWSNFLIEAFVDNFSFSYMLNSSYSYLNLPDEKFKKCIKSIQTILLSIAKQNFTKEDFKNLVFECIGKISESSFLTLKNLISDIPDKLKSMNLKLADVIQLNRIIIYKNQFLIIEMIESIIIMHSMKIIKGISLFDHLTLIMQELPATVIHEEFYSQMLSHLSVGIIELIPICAWYCFKENNLENLNRFVSVFNNCKSITNLGILIWPIILALKFPDSKHLIIYHIADLFISKWKDILILIDLVCTAIEQQMKLKVDSKDLQFYFMDYLLEKIISLNDPLFLQEFVDYYIFMIIYQRQTFYFCDEIQKLFMDTYNQECKNLVKSDLPFIIPQALYSNIVEISKNESYDLNFVSFFRIDTNNNQLIDLPRIQKLFKVFDENNSVRKETIIKVFLYLLSSRNKQFFENQLAKNNISENEISQTPQFLKTLYQLNFLDISTEYKKIFKELSKKIGESIKPIFSFLKFGFDYHPYGDFQSIVPQRNRKNRIIWTRLWSSLSISKGPWDSKMVTEYRGPSRWKRDNTICLSLCPMKMKKNFHFITHGKPSIKKDHPKTALALFANSSSDLISSPLTRPKSPEQIKSTENVNEVEIENADEVSKRSDKLILIENCKLIKVIGEFDSKFLIFKDRIEIQTTNKKSITIPFDKINSVLRKSRFHRSTAIEIYTSERSTFFVDFQKEEIWNSVIDSLAKRVKCKHFQPKLTFSENFQSFNYTLKWEKGEMSNFDYLMHLNILSGRSFNDLSQYPFLPWVLVDYQSRKLNLSDERIFRPLNKPVGAIDGDNLNRIVSRYNDSLLDDDELGKPNLFPSGPISPLSICLYLTRMEPFTTLHVQLQGGKFDMPDRLVTSIGSLFNSIVRGNGESWELSPEFFFQAEFLTNDNEFDLGKINNEKVDDIELPLWADSPFDFIYKHRKALESEFVSAHLNDWIDLNFGFLQKNIEHYNLYDDKLYEDVWSHYSLNDERFRKIIETTLLMVGQIPPKIFRAPHPKRNVVNYSALQQSAKIFPIGSLPEESTFCVFSHEKDKCLLLSVSETYELTTYSIAFDDNNGSIKLLDKKNVFDILRKKIAKNRNPSSEAANTETDSMSDEIESEYHLVKIGVGKFAIANETSFLSCSISDQEFYEKIPALSCISCSNNWTVFSCKESILNIYFKDKKVASTHQYRDVITCCAVSCTYQMIVTGTKDGGLIIGTLSGINVRVLELGSTPKKVLITPGWGFIVAYTEPLNSKLNNHATSPEIVVHSLNGTFIRKLQLDAPIDDWYCWMSRRGFDFIAFSQGRKISFSEVYFLDKNFVTRVPRDLVGFTYDFNRNTFLFVETDGVVEKLSYPIDDLIVDKNII